MKNIKKYVFEKKFNINIIKFSIKKKQKVL